MTRSMLLAALCFALSSSAGCAGQALRAEELPERPIAVRYFDTNEMRSRAELLEQMRERRNASLQNSGVARVDDLRSYFERLLGIEQSTEEGLDGRYPGRLVLLDPREGVRTPIEGARPGAVPRDVSSDGARVLFTQLEGRYRQLFEVELASGEVRALSRGPQVHPDGCYGPEGRLVLLSASIHDGHAVSQVDLTQPGGLGAETISDGPADYAVSCAPDGSAVAWVRQTRRGDQIIVRSPVVDGENRVLGFGRFPAFSADGQWLVYSQRVGKRWALHRIRPDGSGRARIGLGSLDELQAVFSPDGALLLYVGDEGIDQNLYLRRFDGTGDRVWFEDGGYQDPVW